MNDESKNATLVLDAEQAAEYQEFLAEKARKAQAARQREQRDEYKLLVDDAINQCFPRLMEESARLAALKRDVFNSFHAARELKGELYGVKSEQRSHTFTNVAGTHRIILGQYTNDGYDDTVNEGIAKVKTYIGSLARDDESRILVDAVLRLLARDNEGNLKASRVMQLRKMAESSGNEDFIDGVNIIEASYRPTTSKEFIRAEYRNDRGVWINVPLGVTEA